MSTLWWIVIRKPRVEVQTTTLDAAHASTRARYMERCTGAMPRFMAMCQLLAEASTDVPHFHAAMERFDRWSEINCRTYTQRRRKGKFIKGELS